METRIATLDGLREAANALIEGLAPREHGATLITLSGELGAGKTAFVQAVAKALGVEDAVTSPTFVLEKIYMLPPYGPWKRLVHIDAYRLKGGAELGALGFDEAMQDVGNLIMLEWPEMVADRLPEPAAALRLETHPDGSRIISYG